MSQTAPKMTVSPLCSNERYDESKSTRCQFDKIEQWLCSAQAQTMSLGEVELAEETKGRELLRLMLQDHVNKRGVGDVGPAIRVFDSSNGASTVYTHKRLHTRTVVGLFGRIVITRTGYCMPGETSIHPLDELLQLPGRIYSYEVGRRLVKRAIGCPFDEAIDMMRESTGITIPKRSAEAIMLDVSRDFNDFYSSRQGVGEHLGGPILVGAIDCKGIPMIKSALTTKKVRRKKGEKAQKKKMATVAAVYTQQRRLRTPEDVITSLFEPQNREERDRKKEAKPERKRVWASLVAGKDSFIRDVGDEMERRDAEGMKDWVVVTDGERALLYRVSRIMKNVIMVLDFLHVLEKLWAAGNALYGEGSDKSVAFVRERALRILQGKVSQVVKGLRIIVTKRGLKGYKHRVLTMTASYYYRNRSRMQYHVYLAEGYPIASGSVEGACKNLIKDRMERSGMRWSLRMAEAMVKLRAIYLSNDLDEYWAYHIAREQERLYPKERWVPIEASS